jgi:hypothetical protein
MSVTDVLPDEDILNHDSLGKRKRDPTKRFDPFDGLPAGGPSKKTSKKRSHEVKEVLDDVPFNEELQATSGRARIRKVLLDLTGDEDVSEDKELVDIANELEALPSFTRNQKCAWLVHLRLFVKPE